MYVHGLNRLLLRNGRLNAFCTVFNKSLIMFLQIPHYVFMYVHGLNRLLLRNGQLNAFCTVFNKSLIMYLCMCMWIKSFAVILIGRSKSTPSSLYMQNLFDFKSSKSICNDHLLVCTHSLNNIYAAKRRASRHSKRHDTCD